ncbi:MAG TPA: hypothetical protein VFU15_03385 [Bacteroidia bacterium]|nr:hypothetical protein [Bacteroidia bacterium]
MKITRENCEAFFLDFYEGRLSTEQVTELFAFLDDNPEQKEMFESFEDVSFNPDEKVSLGDKSFLKKDAAAGDAVTLSGYEHYFIAYVEGLLSAEEKQAVEKFIAAHPQKRAELELLKKTVLAPEKEIVFENKEALKRSVVLTEKNFEEYAIASVEGLLNAGEQEALEKFAAGSEKYARELSLLAKTKLQPDLSVVYENRNELKRRRGGFYWMRDVRFAAAAAVFLFVFIAWWNTGDKGAQVKSGNAIAGNVNAGKTGDPAAHGNSSVSRPGDNANTPVQLAMEQDPHVKNDRTDKVPAVQNEAHYQFASLAPREVRSLKRGDVQDDVDFSDAFYLAADYSGSGSAAASTPSFGQFAKRWVKNKLDGGRTDDQDGDMLYAMNGAKTSGAKEVTNFDLTSSAINRIGRSTGTNLHLGRQSNKTILTFGKRDFVIAKN